MNKQEWKALYREARTLLREEDLPTTRSGSQKEVLFIRDDDEEVQAVVKRATRLSSAGGEWHPIDGDDYYEHFATFAEEAILYRFVPREARPWTVWMKGGTIQLQEPVVNPAWGGRPAINKCKRVGFHDISEGHNCGLTRDGRFVVFDWGVTQPHGPGRNTRLRDMLVRKRRIAHLKGEEYQYA